MATTTVVRTTTVTATTTVTVLPSEFGDGSADSDRRFFDRVALNEGVTDVLTTVPPQGFGITGVADVQCPPGQPVVVGSRFVCTLSVDGRATSLTIEVLSDSGEYRVNPLN